MDNETKKEFQIVKKELSVIKSELKAELKERPTTSEVQQIVDTSIKKALISHPTHDDVKTIMKNELKHYATKSDIKKIENKIDDMGQTIVDAIERGMSVKADKTEVALLSKRVEKLEKTIAVN